MEGILQRPVLLPARRCQDHRCLLCQSELTTLIPFQTKAEVHLPACSLESSTLLI